jgi:hypothetical protein
VIMSNPLIASLEDHRHGATSERKANSEELCVGGLVDLNRVARQTFEDQKQRVAQLQTIIRCDALPLVQAPAQLFLLLFGKMVSLILDYPPRNSKLFIYLKCEKKAADVIDLSLPEGFMHHELSFYTNSHITPGWEQVNRDTLARCQQLAHDCGATISWQTAPGAGGLFTVTLPGKNH